MRKCKHSRQCARLTRNGPGVQVFYGDSITSLCVQMFVNSATFESYFGGVAGWTSARMGMAGSTVEELTVSGRRGVWLRVQVWVWWVGGG